MTKNFDIAALLLSLAFGVLFFYEALGIPAGASDAIGPRRLPIIISVSVILLSLLLIWMTWNDADDGGDHITPKSLFLQAGPLILLGALYGQMMVWFGYLIATFLAALLGFRFYGNGIGLTVANAAGAAILFYFAFVKGMGIYDPPGTLVDISNLLVF